MVFDLFVVWCLEFGVRCLMFVVCGVLLLVVWCVVVWCLLFVVCCLLSVGNCVSSDVWCVLLVVC